MSEHDMTPGERIEFRRSQNLCVECGNERPSKENTRSGFKTLLCDYCENKRRGYKQALEREKKAAVKNEA
jgi:NMD protein affecting ribosome stability and mRNA decay